MDQHADLSPEKLRGGYYTPEQIASFIVKWGMEIKPEKILEPSCGDGAFIKALHKFVNSNQEAINNCHITAVELLESEVTSKLQSNCCKGRL